MDEYDFIAFLDRRIYKLDERIKEHAEYPEDAGLMAQLQEYRDHLTTLRDALEY